LVTDRVVLRGLYQTAPVSLHGYVLEEAAEGHAPPPPPAPLRLQDALARLEDASAALPAPPPPPAGFSFEADAEPALRALLPHWRAVGAFEGRMAAAPPPPGTLRAAAAAADALCAALASGLQADAASAPGELPPWVHECIDMGMGWCGMLTDTGGGAFNASRAALDCAAAGLAALALLCASPPAAEELLRRHATLLLGDALALPSSPGSILRHAAAACLLLAERCGALGCEVLLGWWQPRFVQWKAAPVARGGAAKGAPHPPSLQQAAARVPQVDGAADEDEEEERRARRRGGKAIAWQPPSAAAPAPGEAPPRRGTEDGKPSKRSRRDEKEGPADAADGADGSREKGKEGRRSGGKEKKPSKEGRPADKERPGRGDAAPPRGEPPAKKPRSGEKDRPRQRSPSAPRHAPSGPDELSVFARLGGHAAAPEPAALPRWEPPPDPAAPRDERRREGRRDRERDHDHRREHEPARAKQPEPTEPRRRDSKERPAEGRRRGEEPARRERRREEPKDPPPAAARRDAKGKEKPRRGEGRAGEGDAAQRRREALQLHASSAYWDGRVRQYAGVYATLAAAMVELRPQPAAALATRLLRHLRFYERAADFQRAAEDLVRRHQRGCHEAPSARQTALAAAECGACLAGMAEALAAPPAAAPPSARRAAAPPGLPAPREPPAALLELVAARRVLPLLAALLHVPALHRARLEADGAAAVAAAAGAAAAHQLGLGAGPLLAVLGSSVAGLRALTADPRLLPHLLEALQPGAAAAAAAAGPEADADDAPPLLPGAAAALGGLALALAAVHDFCAADVELDSPRMEAAACAVRGLLHRRGPAARRALLLVASLRAGQALPRCADMVAAQCALLREAGGAQGGAAAWIDAPGGMERLLAAAPACAAGVELLTALVLEPHAQLVARWGAHAAALLPTVLAEASSLRGCPAPGAAEAYAGAAAAGGGLEAAAALAGGGLDAVLRLLDADLPPLFDPGDDGGGGGGGREVEWEAAQAMWFDPGRTARAQASLRVLAALCGEPGGAAAAAAALYAGGLRLLLRALLAATELVEAAQADRLWVSRGGAAVDAAAAAASRRRAFAFLAAAAAAASAVLQHARSLVPVRSAALLGALVEAHAVACRDEGSVLALLGAAAPGAPAAAAAAPVLEARAHLTSALRCWAEADGWAPELVQRVLLGAPPPGLPPGAASGLGPAQLLTAACLLGDLFPEEWPPPGRRAGQAPPSCRKYRAALAKASVQTQRHCRNLIGLKRGADTAPPHHARGGVSRLAGCTRVRSI
jgi:hypothetical protein